MASELSWDHHFCLTCDKQTNGETYCSESCRLADYEGSVLPGSGSSSPALSGPSSPWPISQYSTTKTSRFYIPPAYDFANARPYGSKAKLATLSPSSSFTSLCSMQSNASVSSTTTSQLSETARKELQAYAGAFGQRRRSSCS